MLGGSMSSKKPVVAWVVIVLACLVGFANLLTSIGAIASIGQRPAREVIGATVLSLLVVAASAFVIRGTLRGAFVSRRPVSLYLWGILIVYPLYNVLRALGWYLPAPPLSDEELMGTAFFELIRYVILIVLIVWVALSKRLKAYFSVTVPNVA